MRIHSLHLEHFRSYDACTIPLSEPGIHIFIGENGSGKTNILEALSLLSTGQSFLSADAEDIIRWDRDYCRVKASVQADSGEEALMEAFFQTKPRAQKAFFRRDVRVPLARFVGVLPSVAFLPSDLDLFTGSPSGRRSFLDAYISQLHPEYTRLRIEYERVLKQRNALLRSIADSLVPESQLDHWDRVLTHAALPIVDCRMKHVDSLNQSLMSMLLFLGEAWSHVEMIIQRASQHTQEVSSGAFVESLKRARKRDILLQNTSVGPHRDDWHILADGRDIASFASRGQQRTVLLSMLLITTDLFRTQRGERPLILLDDVFSELDDAHQRHLLSSIGDCQVFLTSTHVPAWVPDTATLWEARGGKVLSRTSAASTHGVLAVAP